MNIKLTYLYRDAGNYKHWGEMVFTNRDGTAPAGLEVEARRGLIDRHWFVAEDAGVPDLRTDEWDDELDHDWHEFHSFMQSAAPEDDLQGRDIAEFLQDLRANSPLTLP